MDYAQGDVVCRHCGLVVSERLISEVPEIDAAERCSFAPAEQDFGLDEHATFIGGTDGRGDAVSFSGVDSNGRRRGGEGGAAGGGRDAKLLGLRRAHLQGVRVRGAERFERSLDTIEVLLDRLHLPMTISLRVKELYRRCADSDRIPSRILRGKKLLPLVSSLVYLVCRKEGVPRTIKEICAVTGAEKKGVGRCYLAIAKAFDIQQGTLVSELSQRRALECFVDRYASALNLPPGVTQCAKEVATRLAKDPSGPIRAGSMNPPTLCAAALYAVAALTEQTRRARDDVAEAAGGITAHSLGKAIKRLAAVEDLVPLDYMERLVDQGCCIRAIQ